MKLNSVRFYLLIGSALFLGCETVVEIDVPFKDHVLVVNSFFNPDSTWRVSVSASRHVLANEGTTFIQNATVSIHDPVTDELIEELTKIYSINGETYGGQLTPEAGKEYKIKVVAPGFTTVEAVDAIPPAVSIAKVEIDTSNIQDFYMLLPMKIHFNDPSSTENFYQLTIVERMNFGNSEKFSRLIPFEIDDPALVSGDDYLNELLISDRLFNGKSYVLSLKLSAYHFSDFDSYSEGIDIHFKSISKSYYDYKTTLNLQKSVEGDPFAQPVLVYNNIENGLGIFAGYHQVKWVLKDK